MLIFRPIYRNCISTLSEIIAITKDFKVHKKDNLEQLYTIAVRQVIYDVKMFLRCFFVFSLFLLNPEFFFRSVIAIGSTPVSNQYATANLLFHTAVV